jgi:hypothetical protein
MKVLTVVDRPRQDADVEQDAAIGRRGRTEAIRTSREASFEPG